MLGVNLAILNLIFLPAYSLSITDYTELKQKTRKQDFGVCDPVCQAEINAVVQYIDNLNEDQNGKYNELIQRVTLIESDLYGAIDRITYLIGQFENLEAYLTNNVSTINSRITNEINRVFEVTAVELSIVSGDVYSRLNNLTSEVAILKFNQNNNIPQNPGNPGAAMEVYYNLTRRIDSMEYGRMANLTADNNIWRRNFRVVNATFEKIKNNNNCLCK